MGQGSSMHGGGEENLEHGSGSPPTKKNEEQTEANAESPAKAPANVLKNAQRNVPNNDPNNEQPEKLESTPKNQKVQECEDFLETPKVETAKVKTEEEVPGFLASFFGNWSTLNKTHEPTEEEKKTDECEKIIASGGEENVETQNQSNAQGEHNNVPVGAIGNENNGEEEDNNAATNNAVEGEQNSRSLASFEPNTPNPPNLFEPIPKMSKMGGRRTRKNKPRRGATRKTAELQTSV